MKPFKTWNLNGQAEDQVACDDCTLPYKQIYLIFGGVVKEWLAIPDSTLRLWVSLFQAFNR